MSTAIQPGCKQTSVMGVSFTRSGPYFCSKPLVICMAQQKMKLKHQPVS